MTRDEQVRLALETIIDLEVEDLTSAERRELVSLAHHIDTSLNRQTSRNIALYGDAYFDNPSRLARSLGCTKADCKVCLRMPDRSLPGDAA